jgi:hypothetical protein
MSNRIIQPHKPPVLKPGKVIRRILIEIDEHGQSRTAFEQFNRFGNAMPVNLLECSAILVGFGHALLAQEFNRQKIDSVEADAEKGPDNGEAS